MMARLPQRLTSTLAGRPTMLDGLTLDPQIQLLLRAAKARRPGPLAALGHEGARAEIRRSSRAIAAPRQPPALTCELGIPGPAGVMAARRYDTVTGRRKGARPALVFFHGGGFVFGDLDTHDELCRLLCVHGELCVIAVEYRLAPEAPFPAAVEDAIAAFRWAHANAAELGLDPQHIAVGGDSAGGNLAAVVAQQCAADGGSAPAFQLLIYPVTDRGVISRSSELFSTGFFLEQEDMDWFTEAYAAPSDDVRAAPLQASDLSCVAPAYVATAGFDPLRDEGEAYAAALAHAGVPVALRRHDGLIHGFANMAAINRASRDAVLEMAGALQVGLALGARARSATPA